MSINTTVSKTLDIVSQMMKLNHYSLVEQQSPINGNSSYDTGNDSKRSAVGMKRALDSEASSYYVKRHLFLGN